MRNPRFSKSPCIILEDTIHPFKIFSEYFSIGWVETRRQLLCWVALSWEHSGILLNHTVITQGHNLLFMNVYEMLLRFTRKMLSFALTSLKCQGNILCATLLQCSVTNLKFYCNIILALFVCLFFFRAKTFLWHMEFVLYLFSVHLQLIMNEACYAISLNWQKNVHTSDCSVNNHWK